MSFKTRAVNQPGLGIRCGLWLGVFTSLLLAPLGAWSQPQADPETRSADSACSAGVVLFQAQHFRQAEPLLRQCLEEEGESGETMLFLMVIAVQDERAEEAITLGSRALALEPESPDIRYWYGRALLNAGNRTAAEEQWEHGISLSTEHVGLLEGLARLALDDGEDAKAYNLLTQLQLQGVDDSWVYRLLSDLARRRGLWADALQHWQQVLTREGSSEGMLLTAGELAILAGDTAAAVMSCRQAVELTSSAAAYGGYGEALFASDRLAEALAALRQAVALDGDQPQFVFNLANVLEVSGLAAEADQYFAHYVTLAPDDPVGHFNYGIHLDRLGQSEAALGQIEAALRLKDDWATAWVVLGQIQEKLGRYPEALATVDALLVREPDNSAQLIPWREQVTSKLNSMESAQQAGKVHLLHIITSDAGAVEQVRQELSRGTDFSQLATRFSSGPTAAQGGDIGWVVPADMVEPLRSAIAKLDPNEISPLVEAKGLFHYFKRIH
ncbi:MAG: tetratricopeptide repeat protein [bacterium]